MFEQNFLSREALLALWLSAQEQLKGLFTFKLEREGRRHLQISMQDDDQLLMMVKVVPSESNHCSNNASGNCTKSHHPHWSFKLLQHFFCEYTIPYNILYSIQRTAYSIQHTASSISIALPSLPLKKVKEVSESPVTGLIRYKRMDGLPTKSSPLGPWFSWTQVPWLKPSPSHCHSCYILLLIKIKESGWGRRGLS